MKNIWLIGWMCFCWSLSSYMVCSLIPLFLKEVLKASHKTIGFMESAAFFGAFCAKLFSGMISDYFKTRRPLILLGAFATVIGKIGFSLSHSVTHIFLIRSWDRFAKGVRASPTDALIADLSNAHDRAASYSVRQMLYSLGNVAGGILATCLMYITERNYHLIFSLSIIPATFAFFIIWKCLSDKPKDRKKTPLWKWREAINLPKPFWILMIIIFFLMMGRFSNAFINLRIRESGWSTEMTPLLLCLFELVFALVVWPAGVLAKRFDIKRILICGILVLTLADSIMLAFLTPAGIVAGILIMGIHFGLTEGVFAAILSSFTPEHLRGTAFGLFYIISGIATLSGNCIAGLLCDKSNTTSGALYLGLASTAVSTCILYWSKNYFKKEI